MHIDILNRWLDDDGQSDGSTMIKVVYAGSLYGQRINFAPHDTGYLSICIYECVYMCVYES